MKLHLRDKNPEMVDAWKLFFNKEPDVEISCGDIFDLEEYPDAIVSPSNSILEFSGGIDLVYQNYFGFNLQTRFQNFIKEFYYGFLPVGQAIVFPTYHDKIKYLIGSPTMAVPMVVESTINAYLSFRASLIAVKEHNLKIINYGLDEKLIEFIISPGLGTAVGRMPFKTSAFQMYEAWKCVNNGILPPANNLNDAWNYHEKLRRGLK